MTNVTHAFYSSNLCFLFTRYKFYSEHWSRAKNWASVLHARRFSLYLASTEFACKRLVASTCYSVYISRICLIVCSPTAEIYHSPYDQTYFLKSLFVYGAAYTYTRMRASARDYTFFQDIYHFWSCVSKARQLLEKLLENTYQQAMPR